MTIFIPEYIIYWSNSPNLFLNEYSPAYVLIIDTLFFDFDHYTALYKTSAFGKTGYIKYPKWIHYNFFWNKGLDTLRTYMCEKFFLFKKIGVRRIFFKEMYYYKVVNYYLINDIVLRYNDSFDFLNLVQDKHYYSQTRNWMTARLHPKKWRWGIAKLHKIGILQILNENILITLHFDTWDKLCIYSFGNNGHYYWVNLINFFLYNFYEKNWFESIYISKFFESYKFLILYRSFFPMIFEIYIHLYFILLIPIKFYLFYLFFHFVYDLSFLLFFYNKFIIKLVLEIYNMIIGFYSNIIFWISSIRMFKKTVMGKHYDLENLLYIKKIALRNYCYRIFLNKGVSKEHEENIRKNDDCVDYPFVLIYLFKYKLQFFIFLERFSINLSYFFNKYFFIDLLKKYYLRNAISFFNFIIIIFIFCPIYIFFTFIYYIFYFTFFIRFFFKDTLYWYFNIIKYEKIIDDIIRNFLFEKIFTERYDYLIYWINIIKFEHFTLQYYQKDRERVFKKYSELISTPRTEKDVPLEDVIFEYWNERNKFAIGAGTGGFKGHNHYILFNKIGGTYIKNKMHLYNHYFEDPFFFSSCIEYLGWGLSLTKIIRITIILNYIQIEYFKIILNQFKLFYLSFWYYYFFIIFFYPFYYIFYFLDLFHIVYLSLRWDTWHFILIKIYLNFILIKKYLLSFWLFKISIDILYYMYNSFKYVINKIIYYINKSKNFNFISFEVWKFCILFYFYFLRYKFILKVFRIFFIRLWIIAFSLVVIIFFFDNEDIWYFCYHIFGAVAVDNLAWERLKDFFDPNYSFFFFFKDIIILNILKQPILSFELNRYFFDWSIIHTDWVLYVKAWYKQYSPSFNFITHPFRQIFQILGLDVRWWWFQFKLFHNMDYGFVRLNIMFETIKFPIFYHVWINFYDNLIFFYIFYFIDWFYHYFIYRIVCFIDMKLNFLFINELLIFIINIFYNILLIIKYFYYLFIINYTKFYYDLWLNQYIDNLLKEIPNLFYLYQYRLFKIYIIYDLILLIQYYWFYYYHYLYYYSYEFLHNFYNYLIYILKFFYWGNWQYSTYNLIGVYDIINTNITMPLLIFFHKFFMFFLNSSNNLNYWQQEYPNMFHGYQFPFVITKIQQFTGSTTLNRFFFETWIIKVNILENIFLYGWRYNPRFSSSLFLLSYIYVLIIMFFLIRIFIYAARSFRQMNVKTRLSQSGARLWYRMRPVESRHLFTDLEFDWAYSWDWIYEFPKYRKEFFPLDPITNNRNQRDINYFEGEFVVYRFLTKLFEYKRNQNNKYFGWRILNAMDKYYNKRYGQVLSVVRDIYNYHISGINNQTFMFTKADFFFHWDYYSAERNSKWRLYHGHEDRYERFQDLMSYEHFLFRVVMPFLYTYCDDIKYIEYYMKNIGKMRPNLWKFETLLNDKEKHGLNFIEFFFTDKQFYDKFILEFEEQDPTTIFGAFIEHRAQNIFNFKPWYTKNTFLLYRPNIFEQFYEWEDFFLKLTQWDEKYFNNIFNLTFYNTFEWPLLVRTKIQLEQLKELFDAFDPFTMLEETQFLPSDTGIIRGDTETDYEIQQRVNHYWTTVLKKTNDDYHNELGLFTAKVMPLFSYLYGIYLPLLLVSVQFLDTFNIHTNFLDFLPPLFSYIFSTFRNVDMEFSTWAINDPWFVVNPLMGVFITRELGIDIFLTFMGQGYQPWILFNVDIPKNYHSSLFIYSFSNIDFYPFENFFSKWEKSFYFYDVLPLTEKLGKLPNNHFLIDYPLGYDLYHIVREIENQGFVLMPIINELFGSIIIYIIGFLPRMLAVIPLTLMWFFFAFPIYLLLMFRMNTSKYVLEERYYQIKKGRQYFKYLNGLFSKKQK